MRTNRVALTRQLGEFAGQNRRLLLFLLLFLGGALAGSLLFVSARELLAGSLAPLLTLRPIEGGFAGCMQLLSSSCFLPGVLLLLLFVSGLSACGVPVAVAVPFFFGMGLGLTEAYYYAVGSGGVAFVALLLLPHSLLAALALLMGCAESMRLSLLFSGQLLPGSARCGGLWQDFKLYLARFVICVGLVFLSGVVDVGLKLLFLSRFL